MIEEASLKYIEELAGLQFSNREIAFIIDEAEVYAALNVNAEELDTVRKAILRGQLKTEAEVRKSIKEQAKQGASGAQKEFFNLVQARQQREQMNSRK